MLSVKKSLQIIFVLFLLMFTNIPVKAASNDGFENAIPLVFNQTIQETMTSEKTDKIIYKITIPSDGKIEFMITSSARLSVEIDNPNGTRIDYMNNFYYANMDNIKTGFYSKTVMAGDYYIVIENWFNSSGYFSIVWGDFSVKSITLNYTDLIISSSDVITLTATVLPENAKNKEVEWSSSDSNIVNIYRDGKIYVHSAGQATITATAKDGSGVTASCIVTALPSAPEQLECTSDSNIKATSFEFEWNEVPGATGYNIYLYNSKKKDYVLYKTTTDTFCKISKLKAETAYKVQVTAFLDTSSGRMESIRSETFKQYTAPKALGKTKIKSLKKGAQINTVQGTFYKYTVSWKKIKGATGYYVYGQIKGQTGLRKMGHTKKTKTTIYAGYGYKYYVVIVPYRKKHGVYSYSKKSPAALIDLTY